MTSAAWVREQRGDLPILQILTDGNLVRYEPTREQFLRLVAEGATIASDLLTFESMSHMEMSA